MRRVDELRPLTAARLLAIRRETGEADETERGLLSNGQVLAECCYYQGERAFSHGSQVLEELTAGEMEALLERLAAADRAFAAGAGGENGTFVSSGRNSAFDPDAWRRLGGR